ncbi:MAG: hypothetical protein GF353_28445 [Candidatus Lokiarchaeota archaeon]|nr:hypothetical protein [Candidatus Lokiarchaeota archaeon]
MSSLADDIRIKMMNILKVEEEQTDLDNLSVLSRVGMKVASASSSELDADATSASSTALIDLGLRLSEATNHGSLKEIILHNNAGYCILMAINDEFMVFSGLKKVYRVGYYLGYMRELAKRLKILVSGDEITEMALSLEEDELEQLKKQREKEEAEASEVIVSAEKDKEALDDLLGFLDDWDKEEVESMGIEDFEDLETDNIVSIPSTMTTGVASTATETIKESESLEEAKEFKVYEDEVPPVPLEDYTPMDVDEEVEQELPVEEPKGIPSTKPATSSAGTTKVTSAKKEELPPLNELPSLDKIPPPDFDSASEYDTEFVLEEESEALDSVLKELGWSEEE